MMTDDRPSDDAIVGWQSPGVALASVRLTVHIPIIDTFCMCGICGVINDDPSVIEPAVRRMMNAMVHRGPDDEGYELLGLGNGERGPYAGLGFRRLAILDLTPAGHQPMYNPATGDCLVFNGEIYNFRRLRAELQCEGVLFRGHSDTEVLLNALSRWGQAALTKMQGMYALAFYEAKSRRILLARDPLGIKPLYIAESPTQIVFASEVRAILASGLVSADLDRAGIATMLAYGVPQDPLTIHKAIRAIPSGHFCWVQRDHGMRSGASLRHQRFWTFPISDVERPSSGKPASQVRHLLQAAVANHLVADRPVGVFLSAGLDSFAIAALARAAQGRVDSFTVGFNEPGLRDEIDEAAAAASTLGIHHERVVLDAADVLPLWEQWLATADRPSIDGFNTFVVSHAVKRAGKTVALSGLGGDELFGGYPNFATAKRYSFWLRRLQTLPRSLRIAGLQVALRSRRPTFRQKAMELALGSARLESVALRLRRVHSDRQIATLGINVSKMPLTEHMLSDDSLPWLAEDSGADAFNRIARVECELYMGNTLLRDTDAVSMSQSLEVRVPLLDQAVVDYVARLPEDVKVPSGTPTKHLLRTALEGLIPAHLLNRPKTGFCLPIDRWMHGSLRDSCQASIDHLARSGLLDASVVHAQWAEFLQCRANVHWTRPMALVSLGRYLMNLAAAT